MAIDKGVNKLPDDTGLSQKMTEELKKSDKLVLNMYSEAFLDKLSDYVDSNNLLFAKELIVQNTSFILEGKPQGKELQNEFTDNKSYYERGLVYVLTSEIGETLIESILNDKKIPQKNKNYIIKTMSQQVEYTKKYVVGFQVLAKDIIDKLQAQSGDKIDPTKMNLDENTNETLLYLISQIGDDKTVLVEHFSELLSNAKKMEINLNKSITAFHILKNR